MSQIIDWPEPLLPIVSGGWYLRTVTRGSGRGLNGAEQVMSREDRTWYSRITLTQMIGDDLRAWTVLADRTRGRATRFRVPVWVPWGASGQRALFAAAPVGAQLLTLSAADPTLQPGQSFSVNDFLYRIEEVDGPVLKFNPPLRRALAAGAVLEFGAPTILARLATDDALQAVVNYGFYSDAISFELLEALDR